jgi:CubicO group peptidase (beta-lactamase class C family)
MLTGKTLAERTALPLALMFSLLATSSAYAQAGRIPATTARLDAVANSYTPKDAFMGAVLVASGNDLLLNRGYGEADLEWGIPNAPDVKFRLGSLTKQFTAALVLMLQEDGKLKLSDPVSKYIPDAPKSWAVITLEELLGHVSGIPNFTDDDRFPVWGMSPHTLSERLAFIEAKPLGFDPGSKFEYSNSNYEVLGAVIEKVSGRSYAEMLQQRIFQPLGMNNSGLDTDELVLSKRAQGYQPGAKGPEQARSESMTVPWAAGSIYSTTGDLLRWEQGLFGGKLISPASLKLMTTPGKGDYGLGLRISKRDGRIVIDHGGGIEGFNTYLGYEPEKRITVVVLSNVNGIVPEFMGLQLLDVASGKIVILPTEHKPMPIQLDELGRFEGEFRLPSGTSIVMAKGDKGLAMTRGSGSSRDVFYEGTTQGRANFYDPARYLEIEFVSNDSGLVNSVILHFSSGDQTAQRK